MQHVSRGPGRANLVKPQTRVLTDIEQGRLAQVSWVIPDWADSDHPGNGSKSGPSWVASIVNAVGVIKQLDTAKEPIPSILTNSLLPHRVAAVCARNGVRLIHPSTDCVFAGRRGPYAESDTADAEDLYGRSKLLGELNQPGCLTLRSSIVGRELRGRSSLVEWFLSQRGGRVSGYVRALYTGMTTNVIADLIGRLVIDYPQLHGIWHVASEPITKYKLLALVNHHFGLGIELIRDEKFVIDRRLDGSRFRAETGLCAPSWDTMIAEMQSDPTPYGK